MKIVFPSLINHESYEQIVGSVVCLYWVNRFLVIILLRRVYTREGKIHHESGVKFQQQREDDVYLLTQEIQQFGNPFDDDGITLANLVTKKVLAHDAQHDLLSCGIIGEKLQNFHYGENRVEP